MVCFHEFVCKLTEKDLMIVRQPDTASFNDGVEKPVNIQKHIGNIPFWLSIPEN